LSVVNILTEKRRHITLLQLSEVMYQLLFKLSYLMGYIVQGHLQ